MTHFRTDFSHEEQIRLCARHLEVMRDEMDEEWWKFAAFKEVKWSRKTVCVPTPPHQWSRERVGMAGHFVRHACESADYPATVDFVTKKALAIIDKSKMTNPRRQIGNLTQWDKLSHEHMVPGDAVLRLLTDKRCQPASGRVYDLLLPLSFRALVTGTKKKPKDPTLDTEIGKLDGRFASRLPLLDEVPGLKGLKNLDEVPPTLYALLRYDAAGLLDELEPLNPRAQKAKAEYRAFKENPR